MSPRASPSSKDERRLALARALTDAVSPLLAAGQQYADLSVEQLITAVDVSRSTFYTYFGDKGALLQAMGEDVTAELADAGARWFAHDVPSEPAQLRVPLRQLFETYRRHQGILRAITAAAAYDPTIRDLHAALVARATHGLAAHLSHLAGVRDVGRTAQWLVWMLERGLPHLVAGADEAEAERQLDAVTEVVWRAVYA